MTTRIREGDHGVYYITTVRPSIIFLIKSFFWIHGEMMGQLETADADRQN